jgi:DNA-binding NarL/FixJ family response regulator
VISAVLADDHPIVRKGLKALLHGEGACRVVGEADDGLTAIELISRLQPDVAILDVQLPDLDGLEVARRVRQHVPETKVIMLSMFAEEHFVLDALRHGAMGYVLKGSTTEDLLEAVETVMDGRRFLSAPLVERALDAYIQSPGEAGTRSIDRYDLLTEREREVLQLAARGMPPVEIAAWFSVNAKTAERHLANISRKLGLATHGDLLRYAADRRLIPGEAN